MRSPNPLSGTSDIQDAHVTRLHVLRVSFPSERCKFNHPMPPNFRPDSLWHSLCPSYILPLRTNPSLRPSPRPQCLSHYAISPKCLRRQTHSTAAVQTAEHLQLHSPKPQMVDYKPVVAFNDVDESLGDLSASNAELEQALEPAATKNPSPNVDYVVRMRTILRELVYQRNVRPEARHYKALVLANVSAENGSVMNVKNILEEMENEGVRKDSGLLHAALRVCFQASTEREGAGCMSGEGLTN